jgi:hypothetical protein
MRKEKVMKKAIVLSLFVSACSLGACTPPVNVKSEPIEINMNVKIEHEVRVKVDKELDDLFEDEALF